MLRVLPCSMRPLTSAPTVQGQLRTGKLILMSGDNFVALLGYESDATRSDVHRSLFMGGTSKRGADNAALIAMGCRDL